MSVFSKISLVGVKVGQTSGYDSQSNILPLTVIKVEKNCICGVRSVKKDGYNALIIGGVGIKKGKNVNKPQSSIFKSINTEVRDVQYEEKVSDKIDLKFNSIVDFDLSNIQIGSVVDVHGVSKGKGFCGVMKRHNFAGGPASHGASKSHRSGGSIGQCQDMGRVYKGRKMAGRHGGKSVSIQNLSVFDVDKENSLLIIKGLVPGKSGSIVYVRSAVKRQMPETNFVNGFDLSLMGSESSKKDDIGSQALNS